MSDKKNPQDDDYFKTLDVSLANNAYKKDYTIKDPIIDPPPAEDLVPESAGEPPLPEDAPEAEEPAVEEPAEEETIMTEAAPAPPESQALQDIKDAGFTPEEAIAAAKAVGKETAAKKDGRSQTENLVTIAKFRWVLLFVLSLASVLAWAIEAEVSGRPYHWLAWGFLVFTAAVTILTMKFLRLPTRSGLAALCWSATFLISALYGPPETIFGHVPAALSWSGLLTLIMIWTAVAIWRKVGRYKVVDIILAVVLIYAALSPFWALVDNIMAGYALSLRFATLSASPAFITSHLPWVVWPMTVCLVIILPLAAIFALWDQFSAFRRRGARHGGNLFLALAFIALMPYGFLTFDKAVEENMDLVRVFRDIHPAAEPWARETLSVPTAILTPAKPAGEATPVLLPQPEEAMSPPAVSGEPAVPALEPAAPAQSAAPLTVTEEKPAFHAAEAPAEPAETTPVAPQAVATPAVPPVTAPAVSGEVSDLTKRLEAAEQRLNDALKRIDELEKNLRLSTVQPEQPKAPAAPGQSDIDLENEIEKRMQELLGKDRNQPSPEEPFIPFDRAQPEDHPAPAPLMNEGPFSNT